MDLTSCISHHCSVAGSLGNPVVNNPGLALPTGPILGVAPSVPPIVNPLVQASVPALGGLPGGGLSIPPITVPSVDILGVPSECLLLKNMFDPKLEVHIQTLLQVYFLLLLLFTMPNSFCFW